MALKNSQGTFAPGTYNFKKVYLRYQQVDLRFKVLEINIFESIFQPCMTADITLIDAENLVANLPIAEGDVIELHLSYNEDDKVQSQSDGEDIKCVMEVIKITSRIKTTNQDVQTYTLRLASNGWSDNVRTRISRSYKSMAYSDMVQNIFDEKFANPQINGLEGQFRPEDKKPLVVEKTHGEFSVIIPRWKPITCFNWFAGRSQSSTNKNAVNYLFWEDKEQFNFQSMEKMFTQGPTDTYYVKLENVEKLDPRNYFNIFSYTYEDTGDVLLYAMNGTLGSRLITHDIVSKQVTDHFGQGFYSLDYNVTGEPFDYTEEFEKLTHVDPKGGSLVTEELSHTLSDEPGNTRLFVQNKHMYRFDDMKDDKPEEWLRQRTMQKPLLKYIRMTISTIGNFRRKAGEVIRVDLPSPETAKGELDVRMKGNYLVTSVRRIFKPTRHEVVMEIMKDCLAD